MKIKSAKIEAFIAEMKADPALARRGFALLAERKDAGDYFDFLAAEGFFDPAKIPAPTAPDKKGRVYVPFWDPLDYLTKVARLAVEAKDAALINKVLDVIRSVTGYKDADGNGLKNTSMFRSFADILGLVPASALSLKDMDLIGDWLDWQYSRNSGMIINALSKGLVPRLLASDAEDDKKKLAKVLEYCTAIKWEDMKWGDKVKKEPKPVVDQYWLRKFIGEFSGRFGMKLGAMTAPVFEARLREIAADDNGLSSMSWLVRPAVEKHAQNHAWGGPENEMIEGLRDTIAEWVKAEPAAVVVYVSNLLDDDLAILRRIAINALNDHFDALRELAPKLAAPRYFDLDATHEMYNFLEKHFADLGKDTQAKLLAVIKTLESHDKSEEAARSSKRLVRKWLTPIAGKGLEAADSLLAELNADASIGVLEEHPDLHVYAESKWGFGESPYQAAELVAFALDGSLVKTLDSFKPGNFWEGPTGEGLIAALKEATKIDLPLFMAQLPALKATNVAYQYAVIEGMREKWVSKPTPSDDVNWAVIWEKFFDFVDSQINDPAFWAKEDPDLGDMVPDRSGFIRTVADTMRDGTAEDKLSYPPALLPRGLQVLRVFLQKVDVREDFDFSEPLTSAINATKGRVIESLINHSLRACRVADLGGAGHEQAWNEVRPLFDSELASCQDANFEFSAIMGRSLSNLGYLSESWLAENIKGIFPEAYQRNFVSAIDGYRYSVPTKASYLLMRDGGIIDFALRIDFPNSREDRVIAERIALAYLWGDDQLDGPRINYIFESADADSMSDMAMFFWRVHREKLEKHHCDLILAFWRRCLDWLPGHEVGETDLVVNLARMTIYIEKLDQKDAERLSYVAKHIHESFDSHEFVEMLDRLVGDAPALVAGLMEELVASTVFDYGVEGDFIATVKKLAGHGQKAAAIRIADKLIMLPGFKELYAELTE